MKDRKRNLILAVTVAAATGAAIALARLGVAQQAPVPTTTTTHSTTAAAATTGATSSPSSFGSSRYFGRREDSSRGSSRFGTASSAFPVQKLTGTQYSMLETRSIFYHGRFFAPTEGGESTTRRYDPTPIQPPAPERTLVFEGATEFDYDYVAFIEDQSSSKVLMLKTGDAVGRGRVGQITLNYMDYIDKAGKTVHVAIGKNLEGSDPPATQPSYTSTYSSPPSPYSSSSSPYSSSGSRYSSSPSSAGTTPPSVSTPSSSGGILSPADAAAERLRRRRQAELGGGG